ncbi:MAG: hypothetical protein ACK44H_02680 [Candidatus Kryptonium sp.]
MLVEAKGPVWHKKHKEEGIIPKGLKGVDKQATWGNSKYDGWVYGYSGFAVVTHGKAFLGMFKMWEETRILKGMVKRVCMDGKADDVNLFFDYW